MSSRRKWAKAALAALAIVFGAPPVFADRGAAPATSRCVRLCLPPVAITAAAPAP